MAEGEGGCEMTLQERLRESAKELVRLLEEDMKLMEEGNILQTSQIDNGKAFVSRVIKPQDVESGIAEASDEQLVMASQVNRMLQAYPARKALRILEICKILVTERYGAIT